MPSIHNRLVAAIAVLAASSALHAQDTVIIPCDGVPLDDTYCYTNNDEHAWLWQSECGAFVSLQFTSGTIESSLYDHLTIHDGVDDLAPVLYQNGSDGGNIDLTGLQFIASSGSLYMYMTSNATNCCATDGLRDMGWEWAWTLSSGSVGIHEEPVGNFSLYPNPATSEFQLRLQGSANGATEVRILDVTGRMVYRNTFVPNGSTPLNLDLHDLQSGQYSVVLTNPNWVKSQQLQVIR